MHPFRKFQNQNHIQYLHYPDQTYWLVLPQICACYIYFIDPQFSLTWILLTLKLSLDHFYPLVDLTWILFIIRLTLPRICSPLDCSYLDFDDKHLDLTRIPLTLGLTLFEFLWPFPWPYLDFVDPQIGLLTNRSDSLSQLLILNVLELNSWEHILHQSIEARTIRKCQFRQSVNSQCLHHQFCLKFAIHFGCFTWNKENVLKTCLHIITVDDLANYVMSLYKSR